MTVVGKENNTIPDSPTWILRHHAPSSIHYLRIIQTTERDDKGGSGLLVVAGDSTGRFSLTSLLDYRPRHFWKAHTEGVLGVDVQRLASQNVLISSGRDNHLHIFALSTSRYLTSTAVLPSRIESELPTPQCLYSLDINSLNYCPFSALPHQIESDSEEGMLIAVPHTVDSGYIDIFHFPSKSRIATAIGKADLETKSVKASRAAIVMSLQMIKGFTKDTVQVLAGYEDGFVKMWKVEKGGSASLEWSQRRHTESVMAIALSKDNTFAISVAADRLVVRYEVGQEGSISRSVLSNSSGHACVAIQEDGETIAVGGWDGCVRLYNAKLDQLGSLRYHKDTVQALSFVQSRDLVAKGKDDEEDDEDDDDSQSEDGKGVRDSTNRRILLVSGGKEGRICLWTI